MDSIVLFDAQVPDVLPGGMRGDRANLVFSSPEKISAIIKEQCKNE